MREVPSADSAMGVHVVCLDPGQQIVPEPSARRAVHDQSVSAWKDITNRGEHVEAARSPRPGQRGGPAPALPARLPAVGEYIAASCTLESLGEILCPLAV